MNGLTLGELAKARLRERIPSRVVYVGGVPNGTLPAQYLVVWVSEGSEGATRAAGTVSVQTPALWVTSVARHESPDAAALDAMWGAAKAREAFRDWRPEGRWAVTAEVSAPARRDESIATTTFSATEQFSLRSSI